MQSIRASSMFSRVLTASRGRGMALLAATAPTAAVTLCEKKAEILSKDSQGNIDWSKTFSRIPETEFWDDVAKVAGENVSGRRR